MGLSRKKIPGSDFFPAFDAAAEGKCLSSAFGCSCLQVHVFSLLGNASDEREFL